MSIFISSVLTLVMTESIWLINIIYVGRLINEHMLGGIGLANSLFISIPLAVTLGISSALETLVSQAFSRKEYYLCGTYLNKQIFIITCLFIPISLVLYNSEFLLTKFLGQDPDTSKYCQQLIRLQIFAIYLDCIFESFSYFFTAMERSYIPMFI